jgi:predicted PolB exonuclease-like 3'-5' exonuclease
VILVKPSVIVWDLETVPDLGGFAVANDLVGKSDVEVREAIGDKFPKHIYHSIVCIGALIAHWEPDHWAVDAVGAPHVGERTEKQLIAAFCDKIAELHEIGAELLIGFDIIDWPIGIVSQ